MKQIIEVYCEACEDRDIDKLVYPNFTTFESAWEFIKSQKDFSKPYLRFHMVGKAVAETASEAKEIFKKDQLGYKSGLSSYKVSSCDKDTMKLLDAAFGKKPLDAEDTLLV